MRAPRISIAGLMAFIVLLGVTLAALSAGTRFWAHAMLTLAIASAGVALLGRLHTRGPAKAAWTGYLVFGTGYLVLCIGPWCEAHIMPDLLPTPLIDELYSRMAYSPAHDGESVWIADGSRGEFIVGRVVGDVGPRDVRFDVAHDNGRTYLYNAPQLRGISPNGYRRLWHSTLSLWVGLLGAFLARYFHGRRHDEPS
jgi:hypothetical protein